MKQYYMYCRHCSWMNDKCGLGVPECPVCRKTTCWVSGTIEELQEFRSALEKDHEAYRLFPSSDYWDQSFVKNKLMGL